MYRMQRRCISELRRHRINILLCTVQSNSYWFVAHQNSEDRQVVAFTGGHARVRFVVHTHAPSGQPGSLGKSYFPEDTLSNHVAVLQEI